MSTTDQDTSPIPFWICHDPRVSVGRYTYGNPKIMIWTEHERVNVGSFCSIADHVTIFAGGEHNHHWATTYPLRIAFNDPVANKDGHPATKGPTVIGHDVWLGYGATIMSGVNIGDGAVIGAHSVVTQNVPAYAIYAGNPAVFKKMRFDTATIQHLQAMQWWHWPLEKIRANVHLLCNPSLTDLLQQHPIATPVLSTKHKASIIKKSKPSSNTFYCIYLASKAN
jgi:acetyltransferase-like isoleucine patch superfamily enzyme